MTHPRRETRRAILRAAYERFYRAGFARVSVDDIAAAAGVTKKTLYYHFPSKDALMGAVLDNQHEFALRQFERWVDAGAGDAVRFTDAMFKSLARWAAKPGWSGAGFTRIVMELADLPGHPARVGARRHKRLVEDWFTSQFEALGIVSARAAARRIQLLLEGCMALMLIHGETSFASEAAEAARTILKDAGSSKKRRAVSPSR